MRMPMVQAIAATTTILARITQITSRSVAYTVERREVNTLFIIGLVTAADV